MTIVPQLRQRVINYGLDEKARQTLRQLAPRIQEKVGAAIEHARQSSLCLPHVAELWRTHADTFRSLEERHVAQLLQARFDDDYLASCRETVLEELSLGFENRARMIFASALLEQCERIQPRPWRFWLPRSSSLLARAVLFDLACTGSVHLEELGRKSRHREQVIEQAIERFATAIADIVAVIDRNHEALTAASSNIKTAAVQAADRMMKATTVSSQIAAHVQSTSRATSELSASASEVGRQLGSGLGMVRVAVENSDRTFQSLRALNDAARRISSVAGMVLQFSSQTNLLALNAAIEAARAGSAGRGFSVVASEVKDLAVQTASAVDAISPQIAEIQQAGELVASELASVNEAIRRVQDMATAIGAAVEQQTSTTEDISQSLSTAAKGTNEVSAEIELVGHMTSEFIGAADEISRWTNQLSGSALQLQERIETFFKVVRAA
jgi:methyl-accepting chemotaxis protein